MPLAFLEYVQRQGSLPDSLDENYTVLSGLSSYVPTVAIRTTQYIQTCRTS